MTKEEAEKRVNTLIAAHHNLVYSYSKAQEVIDEAVKEYGIERERTIAALTGKEEV